MQEFSNIYHNSKESIDSLLDNHLVVTEKLSGSSFSFQRKGNDVKFYKGSKEIDIIDRTLMVYYEDAISHIEKNIYESVDDLRFCFQYFVNNEPGVIKYDKLPKNKLILTHICEMQGSKIENIISDPALMSKWAKRFDVSYSKPIFEGYLDDTSKNQLKEYLSLSFKYKGLVLKESSFAEHIVNILNPSVSSTMLQENLYKPIDSFIFTFNTMNESYKTKLLDPYTVNKIQKGKSKTPKFKADINEILLIDLLSFINERGLLANQLCEEKPKQKYIELMSNIFNDYVSKKKSLNNLIIDEAKFAKGPEFSVNLNLLKNDKTRELIENSQTLKNVFKIMVGSFRKSRNASKNSVMTQIVLGEFNSLVEKIQEEINKKTDKSFKTFKDFIIESNESLEDLLFEEMELKFDEFLNIGKIQFKK